MKLKETLSIVLALSMAAGLSVAGCAAETVNNTEAETSILIGDSTQEAQPRSFYRSFSGNITGDKWTKVAWDVNFYGEHDYRINLTSSTIDCPVAFRLQVNGINHDFYLEPKRTYTIHISDGYPFSLYAQYSGHPRLQGEIEGNISLGNV